MKVVNDLIKVPELNQTMQQMSREMMKAGLIEETMSEMMDDAFDTDDIEEDADAEVDKVRMPTALSKAFEMAVNSIHAHCLFCCLQSSSRRCSCKLVCERIYGKAPSCVVPQSQLVEQVQRCASGFGA